MNAQKGEIERVKKIYFDNMNNQLDAIEKYRLAILDIYEEQYKEQIRKAPGTEVDENGNTVETLVAPTGDPEIDVLNVKLLNQIQTFFNTERDSVRLDIQNRRLEIRKAEANFENIELINSTVNEYLESLVRLKESRDKLAKSIRKKLENMTPIPISFSNIPDPETIKDIIRNFK
ncbi:hypothetical protein ADIS_4733 [Lunatimonas lonarensis]|uniref:Uncharacterized protein n=2 Tax=Lunatimonas lonarensis TaxID=1232681 RepID=R7ZL82_9BACT|nr:hypothetical protein ADIS_4733 [Lunatimonas lonarensis]